MPQITTHPRQVWRASVISRQVDLRRDHRNPTADDCQALGSLMFDAYRGTLDERHKSAAEAVAHIERYFAGDFGTPLLDCSYVAFETGRAISAVLVSLDEGDPLLPQVFTTPSHQNRGLARALIQLSINALEAKSETVVALVVTVGNEPAEHLYEAMGFEPTEHVV